MEHPTADLVVVGAGARSLLEMTIRTAAYTDRFDGIAAEAPVVQLQRALGDGDALTFRYCHLNHDGKTSTGRCVSRITQTEDGRLRLNETWVWESQEGSGVSTVDEVGQPTLP